jgi:hypothetical protein
MKFLLLLLLSISSVTFADDSFLGGLSFKVNELNNRMLAQVSPNKVKTKSKKNKKVKKVKKVQKVLPKRHRILFGLGQGFFFGDLDNEDSSNMIFDLEYVYSSNDIIDVTLDTHYYTRGDISIFAIAPSFRYNFYKKEGLSLYGKGAFSFYNVGYDDDNMWVFGLNAGAGAEIELNSKYSIGLKTDYNKPFEARVSDKDISGSYIRMLVQIGYRF